MAQTDPELATFQTLVNRFNSVCLNAWPNQKAFQKQMTMLQLWPSDMTHNAAIIGKSDVQGYSGDLGGTGPESGRQMIATTGTTPLKACSVSTRIVPLGDATESFVDAVRRYVVHRPNGRLEDASSQVPEAALKIYGHIRRLDWIVGGAIKEQFLESEAPAPNGKINYQLTHLLPASARR